MVREIVKANNDDNKRFLTTKSSTSILKEDKQLYQDLIDTAEAHIETCVGLAAVQIGVHKRAVVVLINNKFELFINPVITSRGSIMYTATEGCLSLEGTRTVTRYEIIEVLFVDKNNKVRKQKFRGNVAQILQHEIDHCNGILI